MLLKSPLPTCFLLSVPIPPPSSHSSDARFPTQIRPPPILKTITPLFSSSSNSSFRKNTDDYDADAEEEEHVIGDCLVFEEGAFDDPFLNSDTDSGVLLRSSSSSSRRKQTAAVEQEDLVPDGWKEVQAEINMTKKEKRAIAKQQEFGSRFRKRKGTGLPPVEFDAEAYRSMMLAKLKPVVLHQPSHPLPGETAKTTTTTIDRDGEEWGRDSSVRVAPKDPRLAVAGSGLKDVAEFFNSDDYQHGENENKNSQGNVSVPSTGGAIVPPNFQVAFGPDCRKWLPLHTLAASGEFYLMDKLLKHIDDINAVDKDGLTALHKAILGKKMAIANYLLRESANPLVRDKEGATLLHYAVQVAFSPAVKILLLYNVDINLSDDDGWTPLHLAVQTKRTDMVKLLLVKGADKTLKNKDGLTPLDLCLHLGHDARTYELIKILKELPRSK
ncbi:hypothetical protein ACLOJK_018152 [Asimina triloba]